MLILLKRTNGETTPFRNAKFIPAFYFIPKSMIDKCGAEIKSIPHNPKKLLHDWNTIAISRLSGWTIAMSRPSSTIRPRVGYSKPAIMRKHVVLPEPDGPMTVKLPRSPWWKLKKNGVALVVCNKVTASPQWLPLACPMAKPWSEPKQAMLALEISARRTR